MRFISKNRHLCITSNGKPPRFTFHFTSGVVFHSSKLRYSWKELREIQQEGYTLNKEHRESYSVSPHQARILREVAEVSIANHFTYLESLKEKS